jgi:transcriptional regulator GlxA family with amidase domain
MEPQIAPTSSRPVHARIRPPQIVNRLDEFLRAHLDEPPCLAQLCDATGVSERTLRNACHAVCGTSPKRYLTRRRLEAVRDALVQAHPGQATVTRIATDYGFFELGRFAGIYTTLFGERPSDTLRTVASATASAS